MQSTFNNTIVNITDTGGNTICWSSGGAAEGYRGSRKKTPFAGQLAAVRSHRNRAVAAVRLLASDDTRLVQLLDLCAGEGDQQGDRARGAFAAHSAWAEGFPPPIAARWLPTHNF